jgi:hypothetical protein
VNEDLKDALFGNLMIALRSKVAGGDLYLVALGGDIMDAIMPTIEEALDERYSDGLDAASYSYHTPLGEF